MKELSALLLLFGIVFLFLSIDPNITGATIGANFNISNQFLFILGLVFFAVSFILYTLGKSLEAILIPTGTSEENKKRVETAMKSYSGTKEKPYALVTGEIQENKRKKLRVNSQFYGIYKELRTHYHLNPSDFIIEGKSHDTLENFLYSLEKIKHKKLNHLKIATNKTQYWRFKLFEKKAKKEGLIEDSFKIEPLYTSETPREFIYGFLAYIKDYFRIKSADSLKDASKNKEGIFGEFLKKFLSQKSSE